MFGGVEDVLIELSGEHNSREVSSVFLGAVSRVAGEEGELLRVGSVGNLVKGCEDISFVGSEIGESELGSLDSVLDFVAVSGLMGRADLLEDPVGDFRLSPATVVLDLLTVPTI